MTPAQDLASVIFGARKRYHCSEALALSLASRMENEQKVCCCWTKGSSAGSDDADVPCLKIHSYNWPSSGNPHKIGVGCRFEKTLPWAQCNAALCVYTHLPHNPEKLRLLYNGIINAVPTFNPDFLPFSLNAADLAISTDEGAGLLPVYFLFRDVGDKQSGGEEVGRPIGYFKTSIHGIKKFQNDVEKTDLEYLKCLETGNPSPISQQHHTILLLPSSPRASDSNGVQKLRATLTNHVITHMSCVRNELTAELSKGSIPSIATAANARRQIIIQMLHHRSEKPCSCSQCPFYKKKTPAGCCLNLEGLGLHDEDLQEIMT